MPKNLQRNVKLINEANLQLFFCCNKLVMQWSLLILLYLVKQQLVHVTVVKQGKKTDFFFHFVLERTIYPILTWCKMYSKIRTVFLGMNFLQKSGNGFRPFFFWLGPKSDTYVLLSSFDMQMKIVHV